MKRVIIILFMTNILSCVGQNDSLLFFAQVVYLPFSDCRYQFYQQTEDKCKFFYNDSTNIFEDTILYHKDFAKCSSEEYDFKQFSKAINFVEQRLNSEDLSICITNIDIIPEIKDRLIDSGNIKNDSLFINYPEFLKKNADKAWVYQQFRYQ